MIIAVDGPAAAGKGTIARALARHFGFHFLDTGALYRMVGLAAIRAAGEPITRDSAIAAAMSLDPSSFVDADLRTEKVGAAASIVAAPAWQPSPSAGVAGDGPGSSSDAIGVSGVSLALS